MKKSLIKRRFLYKIVKISLTQLAIVLVFSSLAFALPGRAQKILDTKVSIALDNVSLGNSLLELEKTAQVKFSYNSRALKLSQKVNITANNEALSSVLNRLLLPLNIQYFEVSNRIVLRKNDEIVSGKNSENELVFNATTNALADITIKGTVTDEKGGKLPGVSIAIKGTTRGTTTNSNGDYSISIPDNKATLVFSFVGYKSQEITIGALTQIDVTMAESAIGLQEVIVTAYGSQKQKDVTGSMFKVDASKLVDIPVGQITQKLQGQIPGVQITQSNGIPGQDIAIRIRGAASINAGNAPLYVVDGLPLVGGLSMINPNEVDNLTVLKGSSATSLYGSRAANGVILITTKKAKEGQTSIQFNHTFGIAQVPKKGRPNLMNAKEFLADRKAFWEDKIRYEDYTDGIPELYQNPEKWTGPDTDWFDEVLQTATLKSYNLSLLSSKGKFSSATILGYYDEEGAMINSSYKRYSLRSNNDYQVNDKLRIGVSVAPTFQVNNNLNNTTGMFNVVYAATVTPPIFSPNDKNPDGSVKQYFDGPGLFVFPNWANTLRNQENVGKQVRLLSSVYAELDFLKDLKFRTSFSADVNNTTQRTFYPSTIGPTIWDAPPRLATGSYLTSNSASWLTENTLNYTKTFGSNHNVNALIGYSAQSFNSESSGLNGNQYPDDLISSLSAANNITSWKNQNAIAEWSLLSMFTRFNYNYKNKYLLSASLRRDGSSRFGWDNQWGLFPSLSAGWVVSDEAFMSNLSAISFMKLRAEYGEVGNFNIGNYTQFGNISGTDYVFGGSLAAGRRQTTLGNNNLTWETSRGVDIGLDIAAFKGRVNFTYDYYDKATKGMLYQVNIPWTTGYSNIQDNIGEFHMWGHEFNLNTVNLEGSFRWSSNFNLSINRNKVIKLGVNDQPIGAQDGWIAQVNRTEVGQPIGQFYVFLNDGVYMTQAEFDKGAKAGDSQVGTQRFKDLNGDGKIDLNDRTYVGNPNPKFVYGFTNTFDYKKFDLNIVISGAYDQDKARTLYEWSEIVEGNFNVEKYVINRWRSPENPGAGKIGRTLSGTNAWSSMGQADWIEKASYLAVKNITLGYTLPKIKNINKVRLFLSVQQALMLTNYKGPNPEASQFGLTGLREGIDDSAYPVPRTYAIGLDFKF